MAYRLTRSLIGLATIGLLVSAPVLATQSPWYGGVNVGFNSGLSGFGSSTGFGIYGGYHLPNHVWRFKTAVEVGYDHFGSMNQNGLPSGYTGSLTGHDIAASAVFTYPVMPRLGAYLRAGLADTSTSYNVSGPGFSGSGSASGINVLFGIGVNYQVTRQIGVRAEYRNTGVSSITGVSSGGLSSFLLGATYQF